MILLAFALVFWPHDHPSPVAAQAAPNEEFKVVQLEVNVLKGVAMNKNDIAEIVKEANKLLKQGKIRLEFNKDKDINTNFNDQGNNNDKIETGEDAKLDKKSVQELENHFGKKGKGYKVIFTNEIHGGTDLGLSPHDPTTPVTYLRKKGTTAKMGNTLAHEFAHVFTLGANHKLEDKNNDGDFDDPGERADGQGHSSDKKNLMHATEEGTKLTAAQIEELKKGADKRAKAKKRVGDPVITPLDSKHSSWADDVADVSESHIDLFIGSLFAEGPTADLEIAINLGGLHPVGTDVNSQFEMFFNTDNNPATGSTFGSFGGIDKTLDVSLTGQFPFTPPDGTMTADLFDVGSGTSTPLTPGTVERIIKIADADPPDLPSTFDYVDSVHQSVSLSLFGSLADEVPIGVRATNVDTSEFDETSFVFEFNPPPGSLLEMSPLVGNPGDTVNVVGTNLSPLSSVTVLVDDIEVLQTTADGGGSFSDSFMFPSVPLGDDYFVIASDDTGLFDFSIFKIPPKVGGAAEDLPQVAGAPLEASDSSGGSGGTLIGLVAGVTAGVVALGGAAAWYARRRWLR